MVLDWVNLVVIDLNAAFASDSSFDDFSGFDEKWNDAFVFRACVTTRAIDIIYTPTLLRRMKDVFTVPNTSLYKAANAGQ